MSGSFIPNPATVVRVGVGCFVKSKLQPGRYLIGRRKTILGSGLLALPGGHLEVSHFLSNSNIAWFLLTTIFPP